MNNVVVFLKETTFLTKYIKSLFEWNLFYMIKKKINITKYSLEKMNKIINNNKNQFWNPSLLL